MSKITKPQSTSGQVTSDNLGKSYDFEIICIYLHKTMHQSSETVIYGFQSNMLSLYRVSHNEVDKIQTCMYLDMFESFP